MSIVDRNIYGWTLSIGLVALCSLLYFSREPSITLHPGLYAEDGSIFLQAAIDSGSSSLAQPYAGYSHLLQRLAALFAVGWMSPLNYPSFFLAVAWRQGDVPFAVELR